MAHEPPQPPPVDAPQVLLFGHSGAGKSALLGALLKAAETQGPTLRGEVLEPTGRLASIRDAVYQNVELARTDSEITSYTVRLRPWRDGTRAVTEPVTVVLNDCSGRAADSLIQHPDKLHDFRTKAPVARAVIEADAIVLLVNGAADDDELREAFEEFDTFLTIVSQAKSDAREVGGFPVLLVLTQCDRLVRPDDTSATWEDRINERADRAWAKFDAFLKDAAGDEATPSPFLPFGSIDLVVHAVAVRVPKVGGLPAQPDVPFKVAELFRDCFTAAKVHRDRVTASARRLRWTVRLAMTFVGAMFLSVILVTIFRPPPADPDLAERVVGYQLHEPEAAVRLAYPYLSRNREALSRFHRDPAFGQLSDDLRQFVTGRLKEIDDYEGYRGKLVTAVAPGDTRTLDDLERVEKTLRGEFAIPREYGWGETLAVQLRDKWLADAAAIRKAEENFLDRERDFIRRGTYLTLRDTLAGDWRNQVTELVGEASRPPAVLTAPLADSPTIKQPRGESVTNRVPYEFERVYNARKEWDATRDRLLHLRDLGDALGLTGGEAKLAVLVLPEPTSLDESAKLPGQRWTALFNSFTPTAEGFPEWEVRNFPDPARSLLTDRLNRSLRTGTRHVQSLILARMGPDVAQSDTPTWWQAFAVELAKADAPFVEWGRLLHFLARLRDHDAPNPVTELATFLKQDRFDLNLSGFDLVIPPDISLDKVAPAGAFTLTVTARGAQPETRSFKQVGSGQREGRTTKYRFAPDGDTKLTYRPGNELKAEVPLKVGNQEAKLVWDAPGTGTFQFDKLAREPRLVKGEASEPAPGVRIITPDLPRLPVLFPELKR